MTCSPPPRHLWPNGIGDSAAPGLGGPRRQLVELLVERIEGSSTMSSGRVVRITSAPTSMPPQGWKKFLNSWKFYEADHIIVGGDITGKFVVPVIERAATRTR